MLYLSHLGHPFSTSNISPTTPQSLPPESQTQGSDPRSLSRAWVKILDIPVEVLVEILKCLECKYILRCRRLNHFFRQVILSSLELQYIIHLALTNHIDNPHSTLPTSSKLSLLLDRRERWKSLDWTSSVRVPLRGGCHAYELVGGVFAKSVNFGVGPGAWGAGSRHFVAALLPTRHHHTPSKVQRQDLGVPARDFAIDPTQDLIALVDIDDSVPTSTKIQVHLRTISTNSPHKQARNPTLCAPIPFQIGACFIQIVKDVIGMFFWLHGPSLIIWNWISGELLVVYLPGGLHSLTLFDGNIAAVGESGVEELEELGREGAIGELNPGTWDFSFLSERAFMLTILGGRGSIFIYTFCGGSAEGIGRRKSPTHVSTLLLPALQDGQEIHHFSTHSAPFLGRDLSELGSKTIFRGQEQDDDDSGDCNDHDGGHGCGFGIGSQGGEKRQGKRGTGGGYERDKGEGSAEIPMVPFFASQENRIHLMSFHYGITGPRFHLFVKNDFLMRFIKRDGCTAISDGEFMEGMNAIGTGGKKAKEVEWEDWGPSNTRFLEHNISFQWLRYCHGQKVVFPPIPDPSFPPGVSKLCVIDFNVHPSRQDPADPSELRREDLNATYEVVKNSNVIKAGNLFKEDVKSWLPYSRATRTGGYHHYSGFMIDEERLIGMKSSMNVADGDLSDLDVFTF